MKTLVKTLGILAVATCLCMSLFACADDGKKGDDKIEVVAVSEQKYESVEKAAMAYVADELKFSSGVEYKFAANAMHATQYEDEERFNNRAPSGESESYDMISYVIESGSRLVSVDNMYNSEESKFEWRADKMPEKYSSLAKLAEETVSGEIFGWFEYSPAALYTKTASGFEMKTVETTDGETETNELIATVSDGKIIKVVLSLSNEWEDEGTKYSEKEHQEITLGAFGSTTVTVPAEVTEAANKLAE